MLITKLVSSQEKVFLDDSIDSFSSLGRITALGGETVNLQFIYIDKQEYLHFRPICNLVVEGELAPYVTLRDVRSVVADLPVKPDQFDDNYLRTTPGAYPDLLTPLRYGGKIVISQERLRSIWVEINIPEDYSGASSLRFTVEMDSISVGDTDSKKATGDFLSMESVAIEVLPVALPQQELLHTQWFYCDCLASYYRVPVWSDKHWEIIENFARVAVKRGRNVLYTPLLTPALNVLPPFERVPSQLVDVTVTGGEYSFDFSRVDRWVDMCDRVGVKYLEISHFYHQDQAQHSAKVYGTVDGEYKQIFTWDTLSTDAEYVRFLRSLIGGFVAHMKARGDDTRCFYHISDEPGLENLQRFNTVKDNIADLLEGYTIMDALSNLEFYNSGAVTTPVPTTTHAMPFIEAGVPDLWVYYACNQIIDVSNCYLAMPSWRTRSIGMQMYKYNIKGFLHWGYNFYYNRASGDQINPFIDLGGEDWVPAGDTFIVYPDADGTPLESIRIMTMEEAVQDIRAMHLAESYYSHEEVVGEMERALGDEITFERCARSADEMLRVRAAVDNMISRALRR